MARVLIFLLGLLGLLLVWGLCIPIWLSAFDPPLPTVGPSGNPILYPFHYIEFILINGQKVTIEITPWSKAISAGVATLYTAVFFLFAASLLRRRG